MNHHNPENKECPVSWCESRAGLLDLCNEQLGAGVLHPCTCPDTKNCPECQYEEGHGLTCSKYVMRVWKEESDHIEREIIKELIQPTPNET